MLRRDFKFYDSDENQGYFEDLPKNIKEIVKDLLVKYGSDIDPQGYKYPKECVDDIECHSRSGFIASFDNRGGLVYRNFTTLQDYYASGRQVAHKKANEQIQKQIDYTFESISEFLKESIISEKDYEYYFGDKDFKDVLTYNHISDLIDTLEKEKKDTKLLQSWLREIENRESEDFSGENSTIMHELRCLYHGKNSKGIHRASISAAINTEAPYHRSHISWAPNVFCEGAKEIEITWKTNSELKKKLDKALKQCCKEIF